MLSCLPWRGDILGFNHWEQLYQLAVYASHMWLGTTHQNQILVLLQCDLLFKGSRIEVSGMTFFVALCDAYNCCDSGEYEGSQHFAWIREIGKALVSGAANHSQHKWWPLGGHSTLHSPTYSDQSPSSLTIFR